ncbi:MAG: translation initiation factor IF-2 subunit alpha [Candidatus Heimdallarchaeota archaeon]|nr:translation initiation factor IF-2 subunit alpha [Candidatus Heimdallarchaeota archaeon]
MVEDPKGNLEDTLFDPDEVKKERVSWLPEPNELVVATVRDVVGHGCYVSLDEYNNQTAYVHISEISRTWVKNIRNHVREGQRIVAKVLRVDPQKGHVDLSIKRVPEQMKKVKILEAKRAQTANKLLEMIAEQLPKSKRKDFSKVKEIFYVNFDSLYDALEFATTNSAEELEKLGIDKEWAEKIYEIASDNIIPSTVEIKGTVEISIPGGNGVEYLKTSLLAARDQVKKDNVTIKIYSEGSPRYAVEVEALDYKTAEKALDEALDRIREVVEEHDGIFEFERE